MPKGAEPTLLCVPRLTGASHRATKQSPGDCKMVFFVEAISDDHWWFTFLTLFFLGQKREVYFPHNRDWVEAHAETLQLPQVQGWVDTFFPRMSGYSFWIRTQYWRIESSIYVAKNGFMISIYCGIWFVHFRTSLRHWPRHLALLDGTALVIVLSSFFINFKYCISFREKYSFFYLTKLYWKNNK